MAKGKKTGGRDWKPGQSGNLKGRTPLTDVEREARALLKSDLAEAYLILSGFSWSDVLRMAKPESKLTAIERKVRDSYHPAVVILCKVWAKKVDKGEFFDFDKYIDRLLGKAKQEVELKNNNGGLLKQLADQGLLKGVKKRSIGTDVSGSGSGSDGAQKREEPKADNNTG
ncbi:hypothetical protein [Leptospira andrefontaineae]|uniref:Uncharacterized protein n=1 Tax=Leptospira andrefontaineae TaxID=2484976 RepID=A0A4V3JFB3_9LEPT|nr:hypothetical protein [Leptospira andrefontaineae]TGK36232.1 hypothetical protein EHO65_18175 [Leptospira andrefontaineae]